MKQIKMSANVKKILAITMVLSSAMANNKDDNADYLEINTKLGAVVNNTLALAARKHSDEEFNYVRGVVITALRSLEHTPVSNSVVIGILFNMLGNLKLRMYGITDDDIIHTIHSDTSVGDINAVVKLLSLFDTEFKSSTYYSSTAPLKKCKVVKTKKSRDKSLKKKENKPRNKKLRKLTENLACKAAADIGLEYRFDDDCGLHVVTLDGFDIPIKAIDGDTVIGFKSVLRDAMEMLICNSQSS